MTTNSNSPASFPSRRKLTSLVLALVLTGLSAQAAPTDRLKSDSPFLPDGYNDPKPQAAPPPPQTNGPLSREIEFRGVVKMGGEYQFSIFNKKEQKSYWVKENDAAHGISVRSYRPDAKSLMISMGGRSETITLMDASDTPMEIPNMRQAEARPQPNVPNISNNTGNRGDRRVIPRRRVILPRN